LGNDEADKLAKQGAEMHKSNAHHASAARDRKDITVTTQKMMLHVWESYKEACSDPTKAALEEDDDEVYRAMLRAEFEAEEEYDTYDPFGAIDQEGNGAGPDEAPPILAVTAATPVELAVEGNSMDDNVIEIVGDVLEEPSQDIMHRFSNYGWKQDGQLPDPELQAKWPDGRDERSLLQRLRRLARMAVLRWSTKRARPAAASKSEMSGGSQWFGGSAIHNGQSVGWVTIAQSTRATCLQHG